MKSSAYHTRYIVFLLSIFVAPQLVFAAVYQPGETLNPTCAPTDAGCYVQAPITGTAASSTFQTPAIFRDTITISATSTPTSTSAVLYNVGGILYWSGSAVAGLTSLNGIATSTQLFAVGTNGSDFNIVSTSTTHTLNIPNAGTTSRGVISTTTQSFAGDKTFSGTSTLATTTASALTITGTSTLAGVTATTLYLGSLNGILTASGGLVGTSSILSLLPYASTTADGIVSTTTQTFAGEKTFTSTTTLATTTASTITITGTSTLSGVTASTLYLGSLTGILTASGGLVGTSSILSLLPYASTTADGIVSTTTQSFAGEKTFTSTTTLATTSISRATIEQLDLVGTGGNGYMSFLGQASDPSTPVIGKANIFAQTTAGGVARLVMQTSTGAKLAFFRDSVTTIRNTSGSTITKGQVVYLNGANGTTPTAALAKADSAVTSADIGLALADISNNAFGTIQRTGLLSGVDTSAFTAGDTLYVSAATAGALTNAEPSAPNFGMKVGSVVSSSVGNGIIDLFVNPFVPKRNYAEFDTLKSSNISIGTTSTSSKLTIAGDMRLTDAFRDSTNASGTLGMLLQSTGTSTQWIATSTLGVGNVVGPATAVVGRLAKFSATTGKLIGETLGLFEDESGSVGIGTSTPAKKLHVQISTDGSPVRFQDSDGYCEIDPTSTTWTCTSDARLKTNVQKVENTLDGILALNPVNFDWKTQVGDGEEGARGSRYGLIAQDVEDIFPHLVSTDEETGLKSVAYGGLTIPMLKAMQEIATIASSTAGLTLVGEDGAETKTFLGQFFDRMIAWFAEAENGIGKFFAKSVETEELCLTDRDGTTCYTRGQLNAVLQSSTSTQILSDENDISTIDTSLDTENQEIIEGGNAEPQDEQATDEEVISGPDTEEETETQTEQTPLETEPETVVPDEILTVETPSEEAQVP